MGLRRGLRVSLKIFSLAIPSRPFVEPRLIAPLMMEATLEALDCPLMLMEEKVCERLPVDQLKIQRRPLEVNCTYWLVYNFFICGNLNGCCGDFNSRSLHWS